MTEAHAMVKDVPLAFVLMQVCVVVAVVKAVFSRIFKIVVSIYP